MDLGLRGRTAIVCGASSGLGLASAEALADEGANVAMLARRREQLETDANRIGALPVRGDVTNAADLERLVELTLKAFGGIDILVWNSGGPPAGSATEITDERLESAFELLLQPFVRLVRLCLPHIEQSAAGRIVAITSAAVKEPTDHLALSNTIRPGVTGYAKTLARELGPKGITVNCVAPGRVETPRMTELYGEGGPERRGAGAHPARAHGRPARVRRRRLLPRVRSRRVRHRRDASRRRRPLPRAAVRLGRVFTAGRLLALGLVLLAAAVALAVIPSNEYIFLPDKAHPVAPLVTLPDAHPPASGGVYFVDVIVRKATLLERLFGGLHNGADLYPASEINPPGVNDAPTPHDRSRGHASLAADRRGRRAEGAAQERAHHADGRPDRRGRCRASRR